MFKNGPLVSIVIVAYNSEKYIIDTLKSCSGQSYNNIEIIISDDGSTDSTLALCEAWRSENNQSLTIKIITSDLRKGIPANCNRGASVAEGVWIKFLGADDLLEPDAIENLMRVGDNGIDIVYSRFKAFGSGINDSRVYPYHFTWRLIKKREIKWSSHYEWLFLLGFSNVAPGAFIKREVFLSLGKYDENYYLLEDLPLWHKAFNTNYKIAGCDFITVAYRIHQNQVTSSGLSPLLQKDLLYFNDTVRKVSIIPYYHNLFQIKLLSSKLIAKFKFFDVFQIYIFIINKLGK